MEPRKGEDDTSAPTNGTGAVDVHFDDLVRPLTDDPGWRRRVRLAHVRHWLAVAARCSWNGMADVGCWFTCVPPQRCASAALRSGVSGSTRP
ncbi:hypothetical protein [Dermatobacter hominis]|uniref:hypothetical protein n=1 Tax=Dermatobacter hominis TaxID=2884263 RepID=UPI001D0F7409|nr:hypothetical protein [Dermatobacter hominis]UDY36620.1 hypothetical protein LH044_03545 [Dermatobacter hominis]